MAELLVVAFTAMASSAAPAAVAGATAAAAGGAAVSFGATALSILSGVATVGSVLATLNAGNQAKFEYEQQAQNAELTSESERLASEERSLRIRRDLVLKVGAARVAFAASGTSLAAGSADSVESDLMQQGKFELGLEKHNKKIRMLQGQLKAGALRQAGENEQTQSQIKAAGTVAQYGVDVIKRG